MAHRVAVRALLDDDESVTLHPGAIIGRSPSSTVRIRSPWVSEAHALVSLRGHDIKLLALRGRFAVDGDVSHAAVLEPGVRIQLARDVSLRIVHVERPAHTLGFRLGNGPTEVLSGVTSIYGGDSPRAKAGWHRDADDVLWDSGAGWQRTSDGHTLSAGDTWDVGGCAVQTVDVPVVGATATQVDTAYAEPLIIESTYDTVHIFRSRILLATLTGMQAQLVSELATRAEPADWTQVATEVWGSLPRHTLRKRWDASLYRIRCKFREAGIRMDLVHSGGDGSAALRLGAADRLIDRS